MVGKSLYVLIESGCPAPKRKLGGNKNEPADNRAQMETYYTGPVCIIFTFSITSLPPKVKLSGRNGDVHAARIGRLADKKRYLVLLIDKY